MKRTSTNKIKNNKITLETTNRLALIDYDKAKSQILTELYYSSEFNNKLKKAIVDKRKRTYKELIEDIKQEVFLELMKKDAEYIFKEYVKSPGRIIAIAITIAKTFFKVNPKYEGYPNKSIVHKLESMSYLSFETGKVVNPTDYHPEEDDTLDNSLILTDEGEVSNEMNEIKSNKETSIDILEEVKSHLTKREIQTLNNFLRYYFPVEYTINEDLPRYKEQWERNKPLMEKIRGILADKGIESTNCLFG